MQGRQILAVNIVALRMERGMSAERLAEAAGVHLTYIWRIQRGGASVGLDKLDAIAEALGVTLSRLLEEPATAATPAALKRGRKKKNIP
ncbi:MAG: helix-turn-helix transcriptional regulator [Alphaproteobacteria bacterium]|jgi:transcriptional regulator with XRE-family HTH domain|nr:helix-turn-helix transcriptional regulator [Alphaproteobacteria bacterium]